MSVSSQNLKNLVKAGQLKEEEPTQGEIDGLVVAAKRKLTDSHTESLSLESRFELSYSAAHSLALAALRWHGYRSENRFIVFQCLVHTTALSAVKARVLIDAHSKRNLAAYEGETDVTKSQVEAMLRVTEELKTAIEQLGKVKVGS
jgi:hypothetical protein